jgi:hypothetical protein
MGEEHGFLEATASGSDSYRKSHSGKWFVKAFFRGLEGERNEARTEFRHSDSKLPGDPIAEITGAQLRKREPTRSHN